VLAVCALGAIPSVAPAAAGVCRLLGPQRAVSHVVYIQFDNVHFTRDDPSVPSDLEQMPHLLQFMESNGVLLTDHHTPLVSHTADDLITSITGLYGDRHGMPIANTYQVYNHRGSTFTAGSFAYWTDPVVDYQTRTSTSPDRLTTLVGPGGINPPAPWVPYTRAGCTFGSVAMANTELENTQPDVAVVYGAGSQQAREAIDEPNRAATDFEGLSIHCARGAALCAPSNGGVSDVLPEEPGGYRGFNALFGSKYIAPLITAGQPTVTNLDGQPIVDSAGRPGFPGYDGLQPVNALAYTLALQEHGVPVTYTYVSSAHENAAGPFGPGESAYTAQLSAFDRAFATFFSRLAADGITPADTLFVFGSDENDQFVGSTPTPTGCDGIVTPCSYSQMGEIDAGAKGLLFAQGIDTPFDVSADSAPEFYLHGQPGAGDATVRAFERASASLQATNPYAGTTDALSQYLADPTELQILHMLTGDPARTPTLAMFANPSYWVLGGTLQCGTTCTRVNPFEAWNHGDLQPQITTTWMGMVGPGVSHLGQTSTIWSDHTDTRPTMLALLGLHDDYTEQGRVLEEMLRPGARPPAASGPDYTQLALVYKQIEAPLGNFAAFTLQASTRALASDTPGDAGYRQIENRLSQLATQRDAIGAEMIAALDGAAFHDEKIDHALAEQLEDRGNALIARARLLASGT
jgi:hypothetical protein